MPAQRSRSRRRCASDNCSMTPPTCRDHDPVAVAPIRAAGPCRCPRRRRSGRRGRGAVPLGQPRPLSRRRRRGVRAGDGGVRDRATSRRRSSMRGPSTCSASSTTRPVNFSEALEHCLRALEIYHHRRPASTRATSSTRSPPMYHSMGDNDRAIVTYEQALARQRAVGRLRMAALDARQHRPHPVRRGPSTSRRCHGPAGGRDRPRPQPRRSSPTCWPISPRPTWASPTASRRPSASPRRGGCGRGTCRSRQRAELPAPSSA